MSVQSVQGDNQPSPKSVAGRWDNREKSREWLDPASVRGCDRCNARYCPDSPANRDLHMPSPGRDHIEEEPGEVVSRRTVCRALHRDGLAAKRPGPTLMEHHKEAREVWCVIPPMKQRKD